MSKYIEGARPDPATATALLCCAHDPFRCNVREIEFDGVGCMGEIINYAISEHVEECAFSEFYLLTLGVCLCFCLDIFRVLERVAYLKP